MSTQAPSTSTAVTTLLGRLTQPRQPIALAAPKGRHSLYTAGLILRLAFFVGLIAHSITLLNHW
jgi:hypothetical protein